jgi:hypothetical protein
MRKSIKPISTRQNLSSETIYHFTDSLATLEKIITIGFQARYIYEKLPKSKIAYFVKSVCFCDIPMGAVKYHISWYGDYGIGVKRIFAKESEISPVIYIHGRTPFINFSASKANRTNLQNGLITPYLKQISGKQMFYDEDKKKYYHKKKKFYEEREWRYFPKDKNLIVQTYKQEIELENRRQALNTSGTLPVKKIDLKDIEYLIVKDKADVLPLIYKIKKLVRKKRDQEILISKIITVSQIRRDF